MCSERRGDGCVHADAPVSFEAGSGLRSAVSCEGSPRLEVRVRRRSWRWSSAPRVRPWKWLIRRQYYDLVAGLGRGWSRRRSGSEGKFAGVDACDVVAVVAGRKAQNEKAEGRKGQGLFHECSFVFSFER